MKDFLNRTITFEEVIVDEEGESILMAVHRMRTSAGHASISAVFGQQRVEFKLEEYEAQARAFAQLILKAVEHPCTLPEVK